MRVAVGLAVGLLIGFVASGWIRFSDSGAVREGKAPFAAADGTAQDTGAVELRAEPLPPAAPPPVRRGPVWLRYWGSEVGVEGKMVFVPDGELVVAGTRTLAELRETLARARAARDWAEYWRTLVCLGGLGTPEAHALLVEVMGDTTLRLGGRSPGRSFYGWLKDANVPGLVEAARRRAEIELKESPPDERLSGAGWLSLVALHGGEAAIAWVESAADGGRRDRALAEAARNPLAAARLGARIRGSDHALDSGGFDAFARENPGAAFDVAVDAIGTAPYVGEFGRLFGKLTTRENFGRARDAILALDPARRIDAIPAIEWIREAGIDVSSLSPVTDEPRLVLERTAPVPLSEAETERVVRALVAVRAWRVTWSDAALSAVRALENHPTSRVAEEARDATRQILDRMPRQDDAWDPER
jgi:hypothetical protein